MPEIKQQADIYLINYFCDECKKGHLIFTQKRREAAIKRGVFYYIHKCNHCGIIKEFENKMYPRTHFEAQLPLDVTKISKKNAKSKKKDNKVTGS